MIEQSSGLLTRAMKDASTSPSTLIGRFMSLSRTLNYIGVASLFALVGLLIGLVIGWEAGYFTGMIRQNKEHMDKAMSIVESEFSEGCRAWHTDEKKQSKDGVYLCVKPKFMRPIE